jgi:hypothetical protein
MKWFNFYLVSKDLTMMAIVGSFLFLFKAFLRISKVEIAFIIVARAQLMVAARLRGISGLTC